VTLLNLSSFLAHSKCYIDFMIIILSSEDLFDLSDVFMQMHLSYDVTIRWCFTLARLSVSPWCSLQVKLPTSTTLAAVQADRGRLLSSHLSAFQYVAAVDFVQKFVKTSPAKQVMLNSS